MPSLTASILYNYVTKHYGILPTVTYRLIVGLYSYIIPFRAAIPEPLIALLRLLLPLLVCIFVRALYEKKRTYAVKMHSRVARAMLSVALVLVILVAILFSMLISCQFEYGVLVIATESMTGDINKGDVVMFRRYDGESIEVGDVIVFERYDSLTVHRVIETEIVDGVTRYYTKGDANEASDAGYVTAADLRGRVFAKLPYFGYPSVFFHELFK